MKAPPIVSDCMKSSNSSGNFTHISNDMENTINSPNSTNFTNYSKLSINVGGFKFYDLDKLDLFKFTTHKI